VCVCVCPHALCLCQGDSPVACGGPGCARLLAQARAETAAACQDRDRAIAERDVAWAALAAIRGQVEAVGPSACVPVPLPLGLVTPARDPSTSRFSSSGRSHSGSMSPLIPAASRSRPPASPGVTPGSTPSLVAPGSPPPAGPAPASPLLLGWRLEDAVAGPDTSLVATVRLDNPYATTQPPATALILNRDGREYVLPLEPGTPHLDFEVEGLVVGKRYRLWSACRGGGVLPDSPYCAVPLELRLSKGLGPAPEVLGRCGDDVILRLHNPCHADLPAPSRLTLQVCACNGGVAHALSWWCDVCPCVRLVVWRCPCIRLVV
jgi:hypothetical protein